MAELAKPRVRIEPAKVKAGDVIEIKTLIQHNMETGQRKDPKTGETIPRNIINSFVAKFNGKEVFRAKIQPSISANPFISFFLKVPGSGELELTWTADGGQSVTEKQKIEVS
jgi:sulfur-oxidizing protein SoxZ